jgi:ubiquinone/menaquinone biosynthesis C-methylase UbiE
MYHWEKFVDSKIKAIFDKGGLIIDIGGGLRIDAKRNNRGNQNHKFAEYLTRSNVTYKVLDKVPDYNPNIVGDVHDLPLEDESVDSVLCIALLEHVEEPFKAMAEMYRVLKPGEYFYMYVPFLYYYHPMPGYYGDFYRYTYDGIKYMTRDYRHVEIDNVRGALSTVMNLLPMFATKTGAFDFIDRLVGKDRSKQTSGYAVFCEK